MIPMKTTKAFVSMAMAVVFMLAGLASLQAQAEMIGTHQVIAQEQLSVDRDALKGMLSEQAVQEKLASMGVSPEQVEQRINSLTADELASFNAQLNDAPAAGADALGILVFFLILFVITDMLCATNIYKFVNCVNK